MNNNCNLDKQQILSQARAQSDNPELFYAKLILALAQSLALEQFKSLCDSMLDATSTCRSLFED